MSSSPRPSGSSDSPVTMTTVTTDNAHLTRQVRDLRERGMSVKKIARTLGEKASDIAPLVARSPPRTRRRRPIRPWSAAGSARAEPSASSWTATPGGATGRTLPISPAVPPRCWLLAGTARTAYRAGQALGALLLGSLTDALGSATAFIAVAALATASCPRQPAATQPSQQSPQPAGGCPDRP